ncbi:hypothetical protein HPB50_025976 [Hyalomma asiaticum]|uniref:Uncharacterized protein n=1 Tax=Hyalomma asiaticum TaxID=266040 RepID=A0ACB7SZ56_HYAAI|nr:hypothetical protein HPB50_025976 [Hyalomma asiaticum]
MWTASPWTATPRTATDLGEMQFQTLATPALQTTEPLWPSPPFGLDNAAASNWQHQTRPKHRHAHRSKRNALPPLSPILACNETDPAISTQQLLPSHQKKKPSRARSFRAAFQKNAELTPAVSPPVVKDDVWEPHDTWNAMQPRRMRFFLKPPKNDRQAQQASCPQDELNEQPERLEPTSPGGRGKDDITSSELHSEEVTTIFDINQSLGDSTEPASTLETIPPGSSTDTKCTGDGTAGFSGASDSTMAPQPPQPSSKSTQEVPKNSGSAWKTGLPQQPPAKGFMQSVSRPVGILRHYVTRVNDGSWTWHSLTETSAASTESSGGSHTSSQGASMTRFPSHAACLILCMASLALLSFWACYAIAEAAFAYRDITRDIGDPMTIQPPDERVSGRAINQRASYGKAQNSPLENGVLVPSSEDAAPSNAPEKDATAASEVN